MIFKLCDKCLQVMNGKSYSLSLRKNQAIVDATCALPHEFDICEKCYNEIITMYTNKTDNVKVIFEKI